MATNETEYFLRLHLLNNEATSVLRATFKKVVDETCEGDVDKFLTEFKPDIIKQLKSKAEREVLFPPNGHTDIKEWDVSLLSFILISCCTMDGKISINKLRDVMKSQVSVHNDIDIFLGFYKARIEKMRKEGVIDEAQYDKLYPKVGKSNLNEWDLNLLLSILAQFSSGQNKQKVNDLMKNCVRRDVRLYIKGTPDLTKYLKLKKKKCKDMLQNGKILQQQYNQLFPLKGGISDVDNWDDHLLHMFVTNVCEGLAKTTTDAVNVVKRIRNNMLAHKGSAEIETAEFLNTWQQLYSAIETLLNQEVPQMSQEWKNKCVSLKRGPFEISEAINILKEYYSKDKSEFDSIKNAMTDLNRTVKNENEHLKEQNRCMKEELSQLRKICSEIAESMKYLVGKKKDIHRYTDTIDVDCIEVKIHVASANEASKQKIEEALLSSVKAVLEGRQTEIKIQTISKLFIGISKDEVKVEDVKSGSILLKIKCFSIKCITKLMLYMGSQELRNTMKEMEEEIGDDVELGCEISDESKQSIKLDLFRIQDKNDESKPLVCSRIDLDNDETTTEPFVDSISEPERYLDAKVPVFEKVQTFDVKCPEDTEDCVITSCTALPSGEFVLCDAGNENIKLYDKHCAYRSMVGFLNPPFDSCLSDNDNAEVLISVPLKGSIYRISVDNELTSNDPICLYHQVYGITCCALGIAVVVFDQNWEVLLMQYDGMTVKRIPFTSMDSIEQSYIAAIGNGNQLVISDDRSQSLRSVNVHTGEVVFEYKDEGLVYPGRVTTDRQDNIYVEDSGSNKVTMISCIGEKVGDILTDDDGLKGPIGTEYNRYNDTIILQPRWYKNKMCVYKLLK